MSWIEPIFDRTQSDVAYAKAHRDSVLPLKGARNHTDLLRITGNIYFLREYFVGFGHIVPAMICKTAWALGEVPPQSEIEKIRADLDTLKAVVSLIQTPATPVLPYNHFQKINSVERILWDIEHVLNTIEKEWWITGEPAAVTSGDDWI